MKSQLQTTDQKSGEEPTLVLPVSVEEKDIIVRIIGDPLSLS